MTPAQEIEHTGVVLIAFAVAVFGFCFTYGLIRLWP